MKNFRELTGWQQSHRLALTVYAAMRVFPKVEQYGDTSQTRRACTSIATNIAKGCGRADDTGCRRPRTAAVSCCGRAGDTELKRFLRIAMGSAADLGLLPSAVYAKLSGEVIEVKKMLSAFIRKLRTDPTDR